MLLTISIPTHNSANYLDEALQSIIKEPGLGLLYEITLSDNSLTSDTENLYRDKYINHKGINYHRAIEYGCLDSNINNAVELAKGEYVWIFGDDDLIVPGSLKEILSFVNKYQPGILVVNSQSFNQEGLIEKSRVPLKTNLFYSEKQNNKFMAELGSYLTYIGAIVVNKELWVRNFDKKKIGSYFAHLNAIFKIKSNRTAIFLSRECIQMRVGYQTWTNKSFEIWNINFAEIIWSLKNYNEFSKNKVIIRYPFHSPKSLLSSRAYGRITFNVWKRTIFKSKKISIFFKLFILIISLIPRILFKLGYKIFILNNRKNHTLHFSPKLALAQLN